MPRRESAPRHAFELKDASKRIDGGVDRFEVGVPGKARAHRYRRGGRAVMLFVALHGVSDVGIYGLLAGKVAAYAAHHDGGLSYMLYLLTFALDSVGDVFGSFFMLGSGVLVVATPVLPRWLGWVGIAASPFLLVQ